MRSCRVLARGVMGVPITPLCVLEKEGTSISDQMAFRSQCAHGWWEQVKPVPADLPGRKPRPSVPGPESGKAFWEAGCADFCR